MQASGFQVYVFRGDSEARTAGYMPVFGKNVIENAEENIKGPSFSDHVNAAAYHPDDLTEPVGNISDGSAKTAGDAGITPFTFWDLIDVINPLQHIPVVSTIYRHLTGDEIRDSARFVGDALYGGAIGAAAGLVDIAFKNATGKDAGETVMAMLDGSDKEDKEVSGTMLADNNLNAIAPAAGSAVKISDIIWDAPVRLASDFNRFLPPGTPTKPERTPAEENSRPIAHTQDKAAWVLDSGTPSALTGSSASGRQDSPSFPNMQETPADTAEHGIPPALIAEKMMQALDAYGAMKQNGL